MENGRLATTVLRCRVGGQPTATFPLYPNGNGKSTEKNPQDPADQEQPDQAPRSGHRYDYY